MTSEEFYKGLLKICEVDIPYQELKTLYSKDKFSRVPGTKELIEKLRKNYKVGLLSNNQRHY
jgi:FMN phosphatase YigB (HAD superfamily)